MNCIIFALRALSVSSSSGSRTAAFRFNDTGTVGVETLRTWFAIRVRWGSGSRHKGGEVASFTRIGHYLFQQGCSACSPQAEPLSPTRKCQSTCHHIAGLKNIYRPTVFRNWGGGQHASVRASRAWVPCFVVVCSPRVRRSCSLCIAEGHTLRYVCEGPRTIVERHLGRLEELEKVDRYSVGPDIVEQRLVGDVSL